MWKRKNKEISARCSLIYLSKFILLLVQQNNNNFRPIKERFANVRKTQRILRTFALHLCED